MAKNGLPVVFSWTSCASGVPLRFAVKRIRNQLSQIFTGQGRKYDVLHTRSSLAHRFELAHQRMGGIDFVVAIGADQQQMLHIWPGQQILEQIERRRVEPLQIVEEQGQRMLRPREYADKSPKHQLEAALRVLWRKLGNRGLFSYDELQFGNEIHHELSVRVQRPKKGIAPAAQLGFAFAQKRTDKALKGLRQSGIRDVALVLIELAGCKQAARRNKRLMELIDDRGFADAGISGNEHQLRPAAGHNPVEGGEQSIDLGCAPVQFLGNQQPVWRVLFAERGIRRCRPRVSHSARQRRRSLSTPAAVW